MQNRIDQLLVAMMEHEEKDVKRIQHFLKVHEFARLIGRMEGLPADDQETLEAAAVVHDIGIHPAQRKYGNCDGPHQEQEGPPLARKLLTRLGWEKNVIERVVWLVGHHHTYSDIDSADYQILVEADFLVNLFESDHPAETQREVYLRIFKTEGGKRLFQSMFAWE